MAFGSIIWETPSIPSYFSRALKSTFHAVDFPDPDGPTIINPWFKLLIEYNCRTFSSHKLPLSDDDDDDDDEESPALLKSSQTRNNSRQTFLISSFSLAISIGSYLMPGKTSLSRLCRRGRSSLMRRGTNDSMIDWIRISCSFRSSAIFDSSTCFPSVISFSRMRWIRSRLTLPAITSTDLSERRPKS